MLFHFIFFPLFILVIAGLGEMLLFVLKKIVFANHNGTIDIGLKGLLGLFFLGIIGVIFNFVVPLNAGIVYIFIVLCAICGSLLLYNKYRSVSLCDVFYFFSIIALMSPLASNMIRRSDAGFYHLPHQLWLRSEPIVIGITNFSALFGFSSLYEYIGALLWVNEQFILLSYLQTSFNS